MRLHGIRTLRIMATPSQMKTSPKGFLQAIDHATERAFRSGGEYWFRNRLGGGVTNERSSRPYRAIWLGGILAMMQDAFLLSWLRDWAHQHPF